MKCRKVKMSTCQLGGNVLLFLARGNSAIREWQHDLTACLRSLVFARMCLITGFHCMSSSDFHPSRHCRFCTKNVTCCGTKVPRVSLYSVMKNKQLVALTDSDDFFLSDVKKL